MDDDATWADIFLDGPPCRMKDGLDVRIDGLVKFIDALFGAGCDVGCDRLHVLAFIKPFDQLGDDEIVRLLLDSGVGGEVVPFGFVVAKRVDAVTEEAKDVFEDLGVCVNEIGAIGLAV